jgi:hypothetical protein
MEMSTMAGWGADGVCGNDVTLETVNDSGEVERIETLICSLPEGHSGDHKDLKADVSWPNLTELVIM